MSRILLGMVAGLVMFAGVGSAFAGIPDPDNSYVYLDNDGCVLATCPAGDGPPFEYVNVVAKNSNDEPIQGVQAWEFSWDVSGPCSVTITAVDAETNSLGEIRFRVVGDETCCCDPTLQNLAQITLEVWIRNVKINDSDILYANSFDLDCDGDVDPIDFSIFAGLFGTTNVCADYNCDGVVNPIDFSMFASHFGH